MKNIIKTPANTLKIRQSVKFKKYQKREPSKEQIMYQLIKQVRVIKVIATSVVIIMILLKEFQLIEKHNIKIFKLKLKKSINIK